MSASFLTTPIYYINAQPHIGHAYTTMLTDAIARSRRLMGEEVFFLTGTDEHGQKVERAAQKAGLETPVFADKVSSAFRQMCADLSISNDDFIRTTEPRHYAAAQEIWTRVQKAGDIYKGEYEGWYCTVDELFVPEAQLVDDKCPTCGSKVERLKEESYYFRLSKYQQPLLDWYRDHPDFVQPEFRLNEVRTFVEAGLQDLSISRTSFTWGVPVPDDPEARDVRVVRRADELPDRPRLRLGHERGRGAHRAILANRHALRRQGDRPPARALLAGISDVRRSATAAAHRRPRVVADGRRQDVEVARQRRAISGLLSRSSVSTALRYFALREMPLGQDANFSDEAILTRFNADLANDLGNLVSRATTMVHRYRSGRVPDSPAGERAAADLELQTSGRRDDRCRQGPLRSASGQPGASGDLEPHRPRQQIHRRARTVEAGEGRRTRRPARPIAVPRRRHASHRGRAHRSGHAGNGRTDSRDARRSGRAVDRTRVGHAACRERSWVRSSRSFPRIEKTIEELRSMTTGNESAPTPSPSAPGPSMQRLPRVCAPAAAAPAAAPTAAPASDGHIAIDDFMKVELRVAKVLEAESVPKSKKLIKLRVDVGHRAADDRRRHRRGL